MSNFPSNDNPPPVPAPHRQAVIFDMDGVVVDSEPLHQLAFLEVFDALGLAGRHGLEFSDYLGKSDEAVWVDFLARHDVGRSKAELTAWKQNRLIEMIRERAPLFPGVPGLLRQLAARHPVGLASGSLHPVIDAVLELEGIRSHFGAVVSAQDVPRGKPAPDVFLRAAEQLGVDPARTWVVEDSEAGVAAGKAAGMTVVAVTTSLPAGRLRAADWILEDYDSLARLLLSGSGTEG